MLAASKDLQLFINLNCRSTWKPWWLATVYASTVNIVDENEMASRAYRAVITWTLLTVITETLVIVITWTLLTFITWTLLTVIAWTLLTVINGKFLIVDAEITVSLKVGRHSWQLYLFKTLCILYTQKCGVESTDVLKKIDWTCSWKLEHFPVSPS